MSSRSASGPVREGATADASPTSVVQLGDSIASGEGTLYGYTYDSHTQKWTGGNIDAPWPPPYPLCHTSPDAYGNVVARYFGASFHQFACTGATFAAGITAPEYDDGTLMRPAEFGNWANQTDLNAEYDAARPDVVLVTFGADDLKFVPIVEACIENGYEYYFDIAKLQCTAKNPGSTIEQDFFSFVPTLKQNYATVVKWIEARAKANGVPTPKIVITNYANPLPPTGKKCPDTSWLYPAQVKYLSTLVGKLDQVIATTVAGLHNSNVGFADISRAYTPQGVSHVWCTSDPWAYGLSIYSVTDPSSFKSQAPFHPTPDGQESIAAHVIPVLRSFFPPPTTSTTAPTTLPPSTTAAEAPTTGPATTEPATSSTGPPAITLAPPEVTGG